MLSKDILLGSIKMPAELVDGEREHHSDNWQPVLSNSGATVGKVRVSMTLSVWRHLVVPSRIQSAAQPVL